MMGSGRWKHCGHGARATGPGGGGRGAARTPERRRSDGPGQASGSGAPRRRLPDDHRSALFGLLLKGLWSGHP